jgi:LysM repeat protein
MLLAVFALGLTNCRAEQTITAISVTEAKSLIAYLTPTASQTPEENNPAQATPTQQATPSPTPMVYKIVEGDTMLAIAFKHGINLEELQAANPDVDPRLLVVGAEIIIPLGDVITFNPVTATPIPIQVTDTSCYPAPDGIWCFVSIKNERSRPLENISANVVLLESSGEFLAEGIAIGAINLLPIDEELPLIAFIPGRYPSDFQTRTNILSVQPLPRNDDRYLNAWLEVDQVEIAKRGERAQVAGRIGLPVKSQPGGSAWILVVAYDHGGNVVGVRKTEQFENLEPGSTREFNIEVFSLGPAISEVRAFVEVRP